MRKTQKADILFTIAMEKLSLLMFNESVFESSTAHMQTLSEVEILDEHVVPNLYRVRVKN